MQLQRLLAVSGLFLVASPAAAQPPDIPAAYHGTWQVVSKVGDKPSCSAADADIRMTVSAKEIELPGGYCVLHGILPGGDDPLQFEGYCAQEDSEEIVQEEWSVTGLGQNKSLTIKSINPFNSYKYYYGSC